MQPDLVIEQYLRGVDGGHPRAIAQGVLSALREGGWKCVETVFEVSAPVVIAGNILGHNMEVGEVYRVRQQTREACERTRARLDADPHLGPASIAELDG